MAVLSWIGEKGPEERELVGETRIGRSSKNAIQLFDPRASSLHARLIDSNGAWAFEDSHSSNGSLVNGERRNHCILKDGDVIQIGSTDLTFHATPAATPGKRVSTVFWKAKAASTTHSQDGRTSVYQTTGMEEVLRDDREVVRLQSISSTMPPPQVAEPTAEMDPHALARRLKAGHEISKATAATLDLSEILDHVLAALFEIFETAERSFILLLDRKTHEMNTAAVRCRTDQNMDDIAISRTALEQTMQSREAVLCQDAMSDQRYAGAESVVGLHIRSMMIAPLLFRDEVLGAMYVDTRSAAGQFTQGDLEMLSVAANQVAACVANAQLHEEVVAAERLAAVGQTVAGLTHCIKNILQGIQGGAFILEKALTDDNLARVKSGWEMVKRNNTFMEELAFDLLSYSKQRPPEYESSDLNALCQDVCHLVSARGELKGVSVAFEPDPALGPVELDPKGMRRSLLNLVTNAVDACADSRGTVTLKTQVPVEDGLVRIAVRDTGSGMSEETQAKLFTAFFSTKGSKGTGLGLPVTHKIVEEHGGRIEVDSREGEGTTFTVCLPLTRGGDVEKGA